MKIFSGSIPWLTAQAFVGGVLSCASWAQSPPPSATVHWIVQGLPRVPMAQALEQAWSRSPEAAQIAGQSNRAQADQALANRWLSAAPALSVSQREVAGTAASGSRETEVGIALPLWRSGQRERSQQAAQADQHWAAATYQAARWRLAARLRDLASGLELAAADLQQADVQSQLLGDLTADVERRVRSGDLAPTDAMAAKAEWLTALAQKATAERGLQSQKEAWRVLTGMEALPAPETTYLSPTPAPPLEQHPEARLAEMQVQRAQRRLALLESLRAATPELGVSVRYDRSASSQPRQNSVALSWRMPLGAADYAQPQIATAMAEHEVATTNQMRTRQQLETELLLARAALNGGQSQLLIEQERSALLRERARLLQRAFGAGETALPELLRALSASAQADAALVRQNAALSQAQARILQAQGMLP